MNSAIEKLDAEIAGLQAEVRTVEAAPPTIAERFASGRGRAALSRTCSIGRMA